MTTTSSDVADEEPVFFTQADNNDESKEQTFELNEQSRQNTRQCVANEEPSSLKTSVKDSTKIDGNTTSFSINGIKANERRGVEKDIHLVLKNLRLKILGQRDDEVLMVTDSLYKNYKTA